MQAFNWAVVRDLRKFGTAIAASKPMIATTIIISTSVNAVRLGDKIVICQQFSGGNRWRVFTPDPVNRQEKLN